MCVSHGTTMLDGAKAWVPAPAMYLLQRTWREGGRERKEGRKDSNKLSMHIVHEVDKFYTSTCL